jgi:hypothetical protein
MKLFFTSLIALTSFSSLSLKAQDINIAAAVTTSFSETFKNASEVQWQNAGSYYKADFHLNGQYATAFYDQSGNLMGVTKNISPVQLPLTLQASLKASHDDYWISEVFELSDNIGTSYFATVENGDQKITLKSISGKWTTYKKSRKS